MLRDPELFLDSHPAGIVLGLDEVHRLDDPSQLLKIVADEYPGVRVVATGPSTMAATLQFRDSLAGRKRSIQTQPVPWEVCAAWTGVADLDRRLLHGGLPESLLADRPPEEFFAGWIDSFYSRDIQELFCVCVCGRGGFQALSRLVLRQSVGLLEFGRLAELCGLSRPTVRSYIDGLGAAHAVHLLRPFHGSGKREIVARPKCYGFDTGFVCFERGWSSLQAEDREPLWEHMVLNALRKLYSDEKIP